MLRYNKIKNIENNILPQLILQLKNYKIILFFKTKKFLQNTHWTMESLPFGSSIY